MKRGDTETSLAAAADTIVLPLLPEVVWMLITGEIDRLVVDLRGRPNASRGVPMLPVELC